MPDVYNQQIELAQEFLNENPHADISRVQCLLRKIIPPYYHPLIEHIRRNDTMTTTVNVYGGQNQIAPKAEQASQYLGKQPPTVETAKDKEHEIEEIDNIVRIHGNYAWGIQKLQELKSDSEKVHNRIDAYVQNADVNDVIATIRDPKTVVQAFALLEAALTTDDKLLLKSLMHNKLIKDNRNERYKSLLCAAIERSKKR